MKDKILVVYTGGTICSFLDNNVKKLNIGLAKSVVVDNFQNGVSEFSYLADDFFEDSEIEIGTLSENITIDKLNCIIDHIKSFDLEKYAGVIVLHGTDTLAYTSSLLSMVFADVPIPIMLVSANKPPNDPQTNANANFSTAVELIMQGIAPNVYVPYKNSDGVMYLHIASTLMQCANFSEDFYNASPNNVFTLDSDIFNLCSAISKSRNTDKAIVTSIFEFKVIDNSAVLLIQPYVGLDYSRLDFTGIKAIVHGTYHSGTVCVERNASDEEYSSRSILHLADRCKNANIPVFMAPCVLDSGQYSSIYDAAQNGGIVPLNMTMESTYAKALIGITYGYTDKKLREFMLTDIAGEIIK